MFIVVTCAEVSLKKSRCQEIPSLLTTLSEINTN